MRNNTNQGFRTGLGLTWMLAKRDLQNRYASSYAGVAWNVGVPLLYSLINVVVFSILMTGRMGERYGNVPFALFYFVPFSLWAVFAEVVGRSPGILREYAYLINKIAFPAWVLPLIPLASALLSQAIILALTAGLMRYMHVPLAPTAWVYLLLWLIALAAHHRRRLCRLRAGRVRARPGASGAGRRHHPVLAHPHPLSGDPGGKPRRAVDPQYHHGLQPVLLHRRPVAPCGIRRRCARVECARRHGLVAAAVLARALPCSASCSLALPT